MVTMMMMLMLLLQMGTTTLPTQAASRHHCFREMKSRLIQLIRVIHHAYTILAKQAHHIIICFTNRFQRPTHEEAPYCSKDNDTSR
jgi:hypothetical protein